MYLSGQKNSFTNIAWVSDISYTRYKIHISRTSPVAGLLYIAVLCDWKSPTKAVKFTSAEFSPSVHTRSMCWNFSSLCSIGKTIFSCCCCCLVGWFCNSYLKGQDFGDSDLWNYFQLCSRDRKKGAAKVWSLNKLCVHVQLVETDTASSYTEGKTALTTYRSWFNKVPKHLPNFKHFISSKSARIYSHV